MPNDVSSIHNEYHRLESVLLCDTETAFGSIDNLQDQWRSLNFLDMPDLKLAREEYSNFVSLLKQSGLKIHWLPKDDHLSLDALYCRDASIVTDHGIIICSMGKENRRVESQVQKHYYQEQSIEILGAIELPGTVEGGDVAWIDQKTLAVGHSYRTNTSGIRQLKDLLQPYDIELVIVDLPHYKGKEDVFHLMSIFSPIDKDKAVVYSPLMPVGFRNRLLEMGYKLIEVPEEEFESMGCNVLAIAPSVCIIMDGNPVTENRLKKAGCEVHAYKGNEISLKGGGGPTCLTRPLKRSVQI